MRRSSLRVLDADGKPDGFITVLSPDPKSERDVQELNDLLRRGELEAPGSADERVVE